MSIIGSYSEEKDKLTPPPPEKEHGPTLSSVLNDPKESAFFGAMLKEKGADPDLMKRLADAKLDQGDIERLEDYRSQFVEQKERVKNVNTAITKETIKDFASSHPELQQIVNMVGPEKAVGVLQAQMDRIAMEDPWRFEQIFDKVRILLEARERAETLDKDITEQVAKLGIDESEVAKILAIDNASERREGLTALVKARYEALGKLSGWKNLWTGMKSNDIDDIVNDLNIRKAHIETRIAEINQRMIQVGEVVALDINRNDDLRHALAQEILGQKKVEEKNAGFKEMKGSLMSDESLNEEWEVFKQAQADWATKTDADRVAARDSFVQEYQKKRQEKVNAGKGFWAGIFKGMFSLYTITQEKKDNLKL